MAWRVQATQPAAGRDASNPSPAATLHDFSPSIIQSPLRSIMATQEQRVVELRAAIKAWEKVHHQAHGQKPTRKDIAADAGIGTFCKIPNPRS